MRRFAIPLWVAPAFALMLMPPVFAQQPPPSGEPAQEQRSDPFSTIGRWIEDGFSKLGAGFKGARDNVDNFNREAGIAAKTTVDVAKEGADAVIKLKDTRVIRGHQNCPLAPNGAPDCVAAAVAMCKAQGLEGGKSLDTTSAEECPAQVMLGRRAAQPGECKLVTFVTKALCQ